MAKVPRWLSSDSAAREGAVPPEKVIGPPSSGTVPLEDDRFRSSLCREGQHEECAHSALLGICGCECHDWLDDLEYEYPEEMN